MTYASMQFIAPSLLPYGPTITVITNLILLANTPIPDLIIINTPPRVKSHSHMLLLLVLPKQNCPCNAL